MLSNITKRLRDPDSAVRSACQSAVASLSCHVTRAPFSAAFSKPLSEALFTEQDVHSQIGAALCLAAAIDAEADPEPARLAKLLPKFERLLKSDSFKAKPALLTLIGSVIGSGGVSGQVALKNLVPCLVNFLSSDDWAARKAAAESLAKLAVAERRCHRSCWNWRSTSELLRRDGGGRDGLTVVRVVRLKDRCQLLRWVGMEFCSPLWGANLLP